MRMAYSLLMALKPKRLVAGNSRHHNNKILFGKISIRLVENNIAVHKAWQYNVDLLLSVSGSHVFNILRDNAVHI